MNSTFLFFPSFPKDLCSVCDTQDLAGMSASSSQTRMTVSRMMGISHRPRWYREPSETLAVPCPVCSLGGFLEEAAFTLKEQG